MLAVRLGYDNSPFYSTPFSHFDASSVSLLASQDTRLGEILALLRSWRPVKYQQAVRVSNHAAEITQLRRLSRDTGEDVGGMASASREEYLDQDASVCVMTSDMRRVLRQKCCMRSDDMQVSLSSLSFSFSLFLSLSDMRRALCAKGVACVATTCRSVCCLVKGD